MPMEAFEKMAQPGFIKEVGAYLGGYSVAGGVDLAFDTVTDRDVPGELSGIVGVVGLQYAPVVSGQRMRQMQIGSAVYTADAVIDRLGIRARIEEAI